MIAKTLKNLPPGIIPPSYQKVNPADQPILFYGFTSDAHADLAARRVRRNVHGAAHLDDRRRRAGERLRIGEVRRAHPARSERAGALGRSASTKSRTRSATQNVNLPTGVLNGPNKAYTVQANGQLQDAASFRRLVVTYRNGAPVHLGDVGQVLDDIQNNKSIAWFSGDARRHPRRSSASPAPTPSRSPTR